MIFFEDIEVDTCSAIVVALTVSKSDELDEIFISDEIFRKEDDLIYLIIFITIRSSFFRELELDSDDGLYPLSTTCLIELESSIHIPSIRDRYSRLTELFRTLSETFWSSESFLESIVSMRMKVDKRHE